MEESTASWLKRTLMRVCYEDAPDALQLDPDTVSSLVSYCELAAPADAAEYLINIVGHESCTEIVEEYLKRRTSPPSFIKNEAGTSMQAYQKPQTEDTWSVRNKDVKATKQSSDKAAAASSSNAVSSLSSTVSSSTKVAGPKKEGSHREKRGAKAVSMAEASKLVLFSQGKPCDCQASRHELINNCLSCGKIVCKQEGEGPCVFCGALVLREGSNYAGLEEDTMPASEAEAAAHAFKDRLVEYDRNSASRTTVIDDQSDFFEIEGNVWASEEEKRLLLKKQEEMEKAEEERKKRVVVTIDLLGRKVVMAGGEGAEETSILLGSGMLTGQGKEREKSFRVKASPYVREPPVYTNTGQSRERGRKSKSSSGNNLAITGRVQYDDHFIEALLGRKMELLQIDSTRNEWQKPSLKQASSAYEQAAESFECA